MSKIKDFFKSPHIQISLAAGTSIITLSVFSKHVLPEQLSYLELAFPPFIATMFTSVYAKNKDKKICTMWYWVAAIFSATAVVIGVNW